MHPTTDLISVGKIVGTHGVKGALKVISLSDIEDRFTQLNRVFLTNEDTEETLTAHIESSFNHKNMEIVKFQEWDNINDVEQFQNWYLKIPRQERPELPQGEYYHDDIKGLVVKTVNGDLLGPITDIFQTGSNDVYEVTDEITKREILIPALRHVVKSIDLTEGSMIVELPEGLLDEEE